MEDRRAGRKNIISDDSVDQMDSELDRLKQAAQELDGKANLLEEIKEEDFGPEFEEDEPRTPGLKSAVIEPDQNLSAMMHEQVEAIGQEWLQEHFINLPVSEATKLVDFCFFGNTMICVF